MVDPSKVNISEMLRMLHLENDPPTLGKIITSHTEETLKNSALSPIERHNRTRQQSLESFASGNMHLITNLGIDESKFLKKENAIANTPTKIASELIPINIQAMTVNSVQRGRRIEGTLVVDANIMKHSHSVLQDDLGDTIQLQLPNPFHNTNMPFLKELKHVEELFPKGARIIIAEPFCKDLLDGSVGIRVDDMVDLVIKSQSHGKNDDVTKSSALLPAFKQLKELGNTHFGAGCFSEAILIYMKLLERPDIFGSSCTANLAPLLVTNISLVHHKLSNHLESFKVALAACFIQDFKNTHKALFRAATAAKALKESKLAAGFASAAIEAYALNTPNSAPPADYKELKKSLRHTEEGGSFDLTAPEIQQQFFGTLVQEDATSSIFWQDSSKFDKPVTTVAVEAARAQGNEFFKQNKFQDALKMYQSGIQSVGQESAILLSNMAACYISLGNYEAGFNFATLSLVFNPGFVKSHHRRVRALVSLDKGEDALRFCAASEERFKGNAKLAALRKQAERLVSHKQKEATTKRVVTEQEITPERGPVGPPGMLSFMNSMIGAFGNPTGLGLGDQIKTRNFYMEFSRKGLWPPHTTNKAKQKLAEAYETSVSVNMMTMMELKMGEMAADMYTFHKRGLVTEDMMSWYASPLRRPGDFFPSYKLPRRRYADEILHSFGNATYMKQLITPGTTHVVIGFTDLGFLLSSSLPSIAELDNGPVQVHAFDMSPYAVAKFMIILQLMKSPHVSVQSILEAWYSTVWCAQTQKDFREALKQVQSTSSVQKVPLRVSKLFEHWANSNTISIAHAHNSWTENSGGGWTYVANIKKENDQFKYITYLLTGSVARKSTEVCGNTMMFAIPSLFGKLAKDESILEVLATEDLYAERLDTDSFIEAGVEVLKRHILKAAGWVRDGIVQVNLQCKCVSPDDQELLKYINSLKPYSIYWSNVPDYLSREEFFKLAREVSKDCESIHNGYSMNWPMEVFGTYAMDYDPSVYKVLMESSQQMISLSYQSYGVSDYFHKKPIDNVRNIMGAALRMKFYKDWFAAFCETGRFSPLSNNEPQVIPLGLIFNIFARSNTQVGWTFTFDPEISFRGVSSDLSDFLLM